MKLKKILLAILTLLILLFIALIVHFVIIGVESTPSEEISIDCNIVEEQFQNRKIFTITSKKYIEDGKVILYFHGGSYAAEMSDCHWDFIKQIAEDTNKKIIIPDYPLIPKSNKNDVENFTFEYYKKLIENINSENIIIAGDSAGGGLALALCEKLSENNIQLPSKLVLISPWLDVSMDNSKIDEIQKYDKQLNKNILKLAGTIYAGKDGVNDYFASPIYGDLSKLNNMTITIYTGTNDILNPDVEYLEEKAKEYNIDIKVEEIENKEHIWIINNRNRKEDISYQNLVNEINMK